MRSGVKAISTHLWVKEEFSALEQTTAEAQCKGQQDYI
jgi:hypothetical protein